MKKRNLVPVILAIGVIVLAGVLFLVTRPKGEVNGVSKEVYDNAASILTLIKSNDIADAIARQKYAVDSDVQNEDLLQSYTSQLRAVDVKTQEETDYVETVYYALCNRYYESMLNVLTTGDELELYGYVTNDEALELAKTFKSNWENAVNIIESKNIKDISSFISNENAALAAIEFDDFMNIATGYTSAQGSSDSFDALDYDDQSYLGTDLSTPSDGLTSDFSNDSASSDDSDYTSYLGSGLSSDFGGLGGSSSSSDSGLSLGGNSSLSLGLGNY